LRNSKAYADVILLKSGLPPQLGENVFERDDVWSSCTSFIFYAINAVFF